MRYFLVIKYKGQDFYGFQRQNDKVTVQGTIEEELTNIFSEEILVKGAGRTDRGVHANGQCLHFDSDKVINTKLIKNIINKNNNNIIIKKCKIVSDDFHSRFSVKRKFYSYYITFNRNKINDNTCFYVSKFDINLAKKAAKKFIGVHNFQNFVSGTRDNYDCIIYKIKFKRKKDGILIKFYGKSFYRYMVRNLVGAIIDVAKKKKDISYIDYLLNSNKTDKMLSTAPAKGLTLEKIYY